MLLLVELPFFREHLLFFILLLYLENHFCGKNVSRDFYFTQKEQMVTAILSVKILVLLQHRDVVSTKMTI